LILDIFLLTFAVYVLFTTFFNKTYTLTEEQRDIKELLNKFTLQNYLDAMGLNRGAGF
jgi:hypothetical protein